MIQARILPRAWDRSLLPLSAGCLIGAVAVGVVAGLAGPIAAAAPFALIGAAWVWLRMPGVLLAAYLFLPFYKAAVGPLSPVDLTLLLAVANASQVVFLLDKRARPRGSAIGLALWVALGILVVAGTLWAVQQAIAIDRAALWWLLILLPSVSVLRVASEPRHIDSFLGTGLAIGCVVVVLGLPSLFGLERLAVIGQNTLQTGSITLMVVLLSLFWFLRVAPSWVRPLVVAVMLVALVESFASGSRGPILAFVVAVSFGFLSRVRSGRPVGRRDVALAALAVGAIVILALVIDRLPGQSIARMLLLSEALGSGGEAGTSISAREGLFSLAIGLFSQQPILGLGTGGFAAYTMTQVGLSQFAYPHNDLLQIAAEFGVVGMMVFIALVVLALLRRLPATAAWNTVRILFVFSLTLSFTSGDIYGDRLLWGLLVLILSASTLVEGREARQRLLASPGGPTHASLISP